MVSIKFSYQPFEPNEEISFLSNFFETKIKYKNRTFTNVEQAYQTCMCEKSLDTVKLLAADSRKKLKIVGRFIEHNPDWNDVKKTELMGKILKKKFNKPNLKRMLLGTDNAEIIYINYWHDTFWGVCVCSTHKRTGRNILGKLLARTRLQYRHFEQYFHVLREAD